MRLIAMVALPLLAIFAVLLAVLFLPLPGTLPRAGSEARQSVALVLAPLLFVGYLALLATNIVAVFDAPGKALDEELARVSLAGSRQGAFGRGYRGSIGGYPVQADFQPASGVRSHLLNVYVSLTAPHQAAIGASRPLLDCRDCPEVQFSDPGLAGLRIFAGNEDWIRSLLATPAARAAVAGLVRSDAWSGTGEVYIQPQRIWLRAHPRLAEGDAAAWMGPLVTLAHLVAPAEPQP